LVEIWHRDIVECIRELIANPAFKDVTEYKPCWVFREFQDGKGLNREYSEMWTGDWWWEIQVDYNMRPKRKL